MSVFVFLRTSGREGLGVFWTLAKVMIPVMIGVKAVVELGLLPILARAFEPVMALVGLPAATGLVWVTALLVNMYGGAAVLLALMPDLHLSGAQVTILGVMILIAHAIPLEQRIAQRAGTGFLFSTLLRLGGALCLGAILNGVYRAGDWLQGPAPVSMVSSGSSATERGNWAGWITDSLHTLGVIMIIVVSLVVLLRLMDKLGITARLTALLAPVLGTVGIGGRAMPLTMVGVLLGLSYGGALIIREAKAGTIPRRDLFLSICLLSLTHSLIEDTLFIMALGADLTGILLARVVFTLIVIWALDKVLRVVPERTAERLLFAKA
ncbi:nucleoside recognition protein [Rhodospirillum rubrum]|uniref:Nucleoside recognition n=1 Tax=Rhodospirillum rubrum (strain ATCC 11170 / ATH 1.1.1 / DSM 467 / LMG 4362 / NCIMB 8255 / S1) TaxID=269796 RepID=Q2RT46_RHORT|nr:nucleoside recognition protein [Rhodospirillum rubrum]ABC22699.1 Nucleoside recognition [Rhodospirillum rubrum ATCC 11170]AEO48418.1 nucleoside recognition [Rhodospirillum rubrum F11]MBK5954297.1 nucleoside recognition protein [Rhodospirillum rubrum]QXG78693.1 nucleoside recognition protein [Rhodospirillum rubrum]HAQ00891.1 nucleoside recognition protein [Rhodospirillum rubrum]